MTPETRSFPGAERPARSYRHNADGVDIAVYEWGAESNPPLFLVHGGSDFAGTFDVFAPSSLLPDTASSRGTIAVMATANTPPSTDGTQISATRCR